MFQIDASVNKSPIVIPESDSDRSYQDNDDSLVVSTKRRPVARIHSDSDDSDEFHDAKTSVENVQKVSDAFRDSDDEESFSAGNVVNEEDDDGDSSYKEGDSAGSGKNTVDFVMSQYFLLCVSGKSS